MKASAVFKICSSIVLAAGLLWWSLPISVKRRAEVARGEELNSRLARYQHQHGALPATADWTALMQTGFTPDELERGYPQYSRLADTTYQLVYLEGFDGPYLLWNSQEQKWKEGF
ncbi:MAG: hypothetical protein ACRYFX_27550 [Janthinobacterium lividum]